VIFAGAAGALDLFKTSLPTTATMLWLVIKKFKNGDTLAPKLCPPAVPRAELETGGKTKGSPADPDARFLLARRTLGLVGERPSRIAIAGAKNGLKGRV
jgi:hypothetical protein